MNAREVLHPGGSAVGIWASIPSSLTAEVAARAGADYVVVDQQHGAVDPGTMLAMLQAIAGVGAVALVRVAGQEPWLIGQALDLGAAGVFVPLVDGPDQAAAAVAACRYAPAGVRSWGRLRGDAEPDPLCFAMVETREGLAAVEAIAATPGLDGIYIGPSDLSLSLGLQPRRRLELQPVLEAIERVRGACETEGIVAGLHCLVPSDAARFAADGFPMVTAGGDLSLLRVALGGAVTTARGAG